MVDEVRRMSWELRPAILDDYGLESALLRHIQDVSAQAGLAIDYQGPGPDAFRERLPPRIELVLYRVFQESVTNIVRHARASRVSVISLKVTNGAPAYLAISTKSFHASGFPFPSQRMEGMSSVT